MPRLSFIIISYNTRQLTLQCLHSLIQSAPSSTEPEIIVVDNASTDDSVEVIQAEFGHRLMLLRSPENVGFGRGNNLAAAKAQGDYLFCLNSDTILAPGFIPQLLKLIDNHSPQLASFKLLNSDGSLQPQGGYLPNFFNLPLWMLNLDQLPLLRRLIPPYQLRYPEYFHSSQSPDWVGGTALLIKRSLFRQLKGFDPALFMYAEDLDLCWRARKIGISPSYFPDLTITHLGQGSGHPRQAILGEYRGLKYLFAKHRSSMAVGYLNFWLKLGALLRYRLFAMMGQHEKATTYKLASQLA